jgi:hypothetical protein
MIQRLGSDGVFALLVQGFISATRRPARRRMLSTRTALAAAGAFLLLAMVAPSTASAMHLTDTGSPEGPTVPWGFNEFWGFNEVNGAWDPAQSDLEIALANAIMPRDLSAHRFFVQWRRVEGTENPPDPYNWSVSDRAYQAMQGRGTATETGHGHPRCPGLGSRP